MFKFISKIFLPVIFWGIFASVVLQIPYPDTITQANVTQLLAFFIPLFLAITLTLNSILKNILMAGSIGLGLILLLILKSLDSLNIVTGILIIISIGLLVSYFRKIKKRSPSINSGFKNLTKLPKIPKLTHLRKQNVSS